MLAETAKREGGAIETSFDGIKEIVTADIEFPWRSRAVIDQSFFHGIGDQRASSFVVHRVGRHSNTVLFKRLSYILEQLFLHNVHSIRRVWRLEIFECLLHNLKDLTSIDTDRSGLWPAALMLLQTFFKHRKNLVALEAELLKLDIRLKVLQSLFDRVQHRFPVERGVHVSLFRLALGEVTAMLG